MARLLGQPLLHFFVLGAAIFWLYAVVGADAEGGTAPGHTEIVVTAGRVDSLAQQFAKTWQRPPTEAELQGLVDTFVREEIMVREALAMGLDRDDSIVRRRMQQKLGFVLEDTAALANPTDAQLQAYLDANREAFREPPRLGFVQIYFDPDQRGASAGADARALLAQLDATGPEVDITRLGDRSMIGQRFEALSAPQVEQQLGQAFASLALGAALGQWCGPVESAYGLHLLRVDERVEGRLPELAEVRGAVVREWEVQQRRRLDDAAYERLRSKYTVTVEGWEERQP